MIGLPVAMMARSAWPAACSETHYPKEPTDDQSSASVSAIDGLLAIGHSRPVFKGHAARSHRMRTQTGRWRPWASLHRLSRKVLNGAQGLRRPEGEAHAARDGPGHGDLPILDSLNDSGEEREKKLDRAQEECSGEARRTSEGTAPARPTRSAAQGDARARGRALPSARTTSGKAEDHAGANEEIHGRRAGPAEKRQDLVKEVQAGGNPAEIRPKIEQLRKDHAQKLEAILTDAQKKQWKEMLGPAVRAGRLIGLFGSSGRTGAGTENRGHADSTWSCVKELQ